jgi:uncharacterized ferritin-like protein (DUF455 family)
MAEEGGKTEAEVVQAVQEFLGTALAATIATHVFLYQLWSQAEARRPTLWERLARLPRVLYYRTVYAAERLKEKVVEWVKSEVCEKRCDCVCY